MPNSSTEIQAKKSLGQHFLRSEKALNIITESLEIQDHIFEIGPGEGVLTEKLLNAGHKVICIEIDRRSIELLQKKFKKELESGQLKILEKDCLDINYSAYIGKFNYALGGNIPYYITGAIFRHTFEQKHLPEIVTFLIQKEVADRIVARDKKESLLSVSVKIFTTTETDVKILEIVKRGSFVPPPKVDSAVLSICNISSPFKDEDQMKVFFEILRASFSHKRKLLLSNLKTDLNDKIFDKYFGVIEKIVLKNYSEKVRAEDVDLKTWKEVIDKL